jgi:hypothetical protein
MSEHPALTIVSLTGNQTTAGSQGLSRRETLSKDVAARSSDMAVKNNEQDGKGTIMADEKTGKKPTDKQGGKGGEKGGDSGEAGGRGSQLLYTCFNDGAGNYVSAGWNYFTCWKCGALNYM